MRYYDGSSVEDSPKNIIELKDVVAVVPVKNVPGAVKKADDNAFFEVQYFVILTNAVLVISPKSCLYTVKRSHLLPADNSTYYIETNQPT